VELVQHEAATSVCQSIKNVLIKLFNNSRDAKGVSKAGCKTKETQF